MSALTDNTFRIMRQRNFRLYWIGYLVSNAGGWIQQLAQGWLVYQISDSAVWLGAIGIMRALPLITFSLLGGTIADRFDRKRILFLTQVVQTISALGLGLLTSFGLVQVWHVLAFTVLSSTAMAFEQPARQSLLPNMVSREDLHAAISLNAIAFNGAAVFGPSLAGVMVPFLGLAGCFYVNALSFGAVFAALATMEFPQTAARTKDQSLMTDLIEGLQFIIKRPITLALISMAAVASFTARPYQQFIPVFAKDVLNGSIGLAGVMQSAPAMGTIIFMLLVASLGNIRWKGKLLLGAGVGFSLSLLAFAWSRNVYLSLIFLVATGGFNMTWMTTINTLLQENVGDEMRGRVMSAYTITALAMMPLGQGPMGYTTAVFGPEIALTLGAGLSLLWIVYIGLIKVKAVRTLP